LVDEADAELGRHLLQRAGHVEGMLARFELAGTRDQRERRVVGETDIADGDGCIGRVHAGASNAKTAPCPGAAGTTRRLPARCDATPPSASTASTFRRSGTP